MIACSGVAGTISTSASEICVGGSGFVSFLLVQRYQRSRCVSNRDVTPHSKI
jgi:hypothetical protein